MRPLWTVRHLDTEAQLPKKLERGRAYFIRDSQVIIIDQGDGRGPVRYGDKPGPQGMAGEPIPSLQGQIDELAAASLQSTLNIHYISTKTKKDLSHLESLITDSVSRLQSQSEENSAALMNLLVVVHNKFVDYDDALNTLSKAIAALYPDSWGHEAGDSTNNITKGEILLADGQAYVIDEAYTDADGSVVVLRLYNPTTAETLKAGDTVQIDNGYFTVDSVENVDGTGIISLTLYIEGEDD